MKIWLISLTVLLLSTHSYAADRCPISAVGAKVINLEVQDEKVYVLIEGSAWHTVGDVSEPATSMKLSLLLASKAAGLNVQLLFGQEFDCTVNNYSIPTTNVVLR